MDAAHLALNAWTTFGLLYVEWREAWPQRDAKCREERAFRFGKLAAACSKVVTALSVNKHKSWYFHLVTWVVPLRIAEVGDLWPFGTGPVEQRGAWLKRLAAQLSAGDLMTAASKHLLMILLSKYLSNAVVMIAVP